jgi:hypothetical protein
LTSRLLDHHDRALDEFREPLRQRIRRVAIDVLEGLLIVRSARPAGASSRMVVYSLSALIALAG